MLNITLNNSNLFILGVAVIANLILGSVVYLENQKSLTSKLFFLFTVSDALWSIVNYLSYSASDPRATLILVRSVLFFAVPFAQLFFFLMLAFPEQKVQFKKWMGLLIAAGIAAMALVMTPYVFSSVIIQPGQAPQPVITWGIMVFFLGAIVPIVLGLYEIVRKNIKASAEQKKPLRYLLVGVLAMFVCIILFNFIFPVSLSDSRFIPYGAAFTFPFVILTTYAILKHKLLNVKLVATEGLVALILTVMFLDVLTARNAYEAILRVFILASLLLLSIYLIRSVLTEVRQREQLQELSKQLEDANKQLKQLDQAKSEFLSVASHQLRTPLTAIKGYASMLLEGDFGKMADPQKQNVQIIFESAERLAALVSDLLDLSRIESGRMEFDFAALNLCETVESVITEISPKAKTRGLMLFFDNVNRSCPEIRADKEKIRQVIINLIDNALKYTVKGGVTVQLHQVGDQLQFTVKDTGIGVDPAEKEKLFEKFFRTKAANELTREGTGLGIYVVKKIVEAHGGKIWFDSPGVNQGTTFYVSLPIPKGPIKEERVKIDSLEAF